MGVTLEVATSEKIKELIDDIEAKLDNGTYGLSALNVDLDLIISLLGTPAGASLAADLLALENKLDNATYGLAALNTDLDVIIALLGTPTGASLAVDIIAIEAKLDNPTFGLAALNNDLDALLADIGNASASALGSVYGILGNPSASLATTILDGIDARANNPTLNALFGFPDTAGYYLYNALIGGVNEVNRVAGKTQILEVSITSAANAGDVTIATVTLQPCVIDGVILHADTSQTTDLTSAEIHGGAGQVITFIDAALGARANLDAPDKQIAWSGAVDGPVRLSVGKTIVLTLNGVGATAVDLTATIIYKAAANGGYLT